MEKVMLENFFIGQILSYLKKKMLFDKFFLLNLSFCGEKYLIFISILLYLNSIQNVQVLFFPSFLALQSK